MVQYISSQTTDLFEQERFNTPERERLSLSAYIDLYFDNNPAQRSNDTRRHQQIIQSCLRNPSVQAAYTLHEREGHLGTEREIYNSIEQAVHRMPPQVYRSLFFFNTHETEERNNSEDHAYTG